MSDRSEAESFSAGEAKGEVRGFVQGEGDGESSCCATAALHERVAGRAAERADVLAYLARKEANALLVAEKSPEHADVARAEARRFAIVADDVRGGMHEGAAFTSAILADVVLGCPTASLLEGGAASNHHERTR